MRKRLLILLYRLSSDVVQLGIVTEVAEEAA
jgi:hypothetical protein